MISAKENMILTFQQGKIDHLYIQNYTITIKSLAKVHTSTQQRQVDPFVLWFTSQLNYGKCYLEENQDDVDKPADQRSY